MSGNPVMLSAIEAINARTSVRSYQDKKLEPQALQALRDMIKEQHRGPFGNAVRFVLVSPEQDGKGEGWRPGTYGVIRGASLYLAAAVANAPGAMEDCGYCLEDAIIFCTRHGLGTCWLGGSFNRSGFAKQIGLAQDEVLPCVTPVGYPAQKRGLVDRLVRTAAGSNQRKPWSELFFEDDFSHALAENPSEPLYTLLQCVRTAPSASNQQPWRVVKTKDGALHLFLARTPGYGRWFPGIDLQRIDMGIAISHVALASRELALDGRWIQNAPPIAAGRYEYISSWVPNGRNHRE